MSWNLPEEDSKTLNGLISNEIDDIPSSKLCIEISNYQLEIMQIDNNSISKLKKFNFDMLNKTFPITSSKS